MKNNAGKKTEIKSNWKHSHELKTINLIEQLVFVAHEALINISWFGLLFPLFFFLNKQTHFLFSYQIDFDFYNEHFFFFELKFGDAIARALVKYLHKKCGTHSWENYVDEE